MKRRTNNTVLSSNNNKKQKLEKQEEERIAALDSHIEESSFEEDDTNVEINEEEEQADDNDDNDNNLLSNGFDDFGLKAKNWKKQKLSPFRKDLYVEHDSVKSMKLETVDEFRRVHEIRVIGDNLPHPITEFSQAGNNFPMAVLETIEKLKFTKPTPIQSQAWPIILKGNDMVGLAETGSGKTLAFVLPALTHILDQKPIEKGEGPIVLILAPTRELAVQIQQECDKYGLNAQPDSQAHSKARTKQQQKLQDKEVDIRNACIYGGEARRRQIQELKGRPQIVIATPGRLLDFLAAEVTSLSRVTYLVLDEADRMLDMGFAPQINQILSQIRPDRQTVMFSATWGADVQELASKFMNKPLVVNIGSVGMSANRNVQQQFLFIQESDKMNRLLKLLGDIMDGGRILIFCMTKQKTDFVTQKLREDGWPALSIHGSRNQQEREWVIKEFRSGDTPLMVATDVAARGLDIKDIKYVINFDMPKEIETYVHRIGRTGRAQNKGNAISFFTPDNVYLAKSLIHLMNQSKHEVPSQLLKLKKLSSKR